MLCVPGFRSVREAHLRTRSSPCWLDALSLLIELYALSSRQRPPHSATPQGATFIRGRGDGEVTL
jgi:hypothetical protein